MPRKLVLVVLAFMAGLGLGAPQAFAESKTYVVIVGINAYMDSAIKARISAEADAQAIYDFYTGKTGAALPADQIRLLLGSKDEARKAELATRTNILDALHWAASNGTEEDTVILCWIGQGGPAGDRTCYFSTESTLRERAKSSIGAADIEQELEKSKSTKICVLLDVNFRGYDAGSEKIPEGGLEKRFSEFDGGSEDGEGPVKPIVVLSGTDGMSASPVGPDNRGLFTTVLLEALSPKADKEGGEADGHLSVDEVVKYVRDEYPARAKKLANADQRPLLASRGLHFSIAPNLAVLNEVRERLKKFEAVVAKANLPEPVAKEGRDYLARMPRLKSQQEMRKHYQALAEGTLTVEAFNAEFQKYVDARKLTQKEAEEFATKILEVANKAKMGYVKPIKVSDLVAAAIKGLYKAIGEDKNIPKNILAELDRVKDKDERALKQLLVDVRSDIGRRDDLKDQKGTFAALESMLHSLDNYSTYIDPETLERWKMINTQVFIGVGIQIQRDVARDMVRVSTPLRNSPAYKEGIKAGDLITKVTNFVDKTGAKLPTPVEKETKGLSIDEVVKTILGPERTQVKLTVERDGKDKPTTHEFTITRGRVEVETVFGVRRLDDDTWDFYLDRENKIGYVRLNQFALMSERDLKRAVESLSKTGLNGLILDLRFNPGGYLESAVKISDLFIDDGLIVTVRPREGRVQEFRGYHEGSLLGFPLVVLVNGQSASASEIVSACIQDHSRGIVMGERSFGKGSVQNIINLPWGDAPSQMKLTTASFWRPNNKNLNRFPNLTEKDDWGVQPHPEYTLKLPPLERGELFEHLRKQEIIPRRDAPKKEDSTFVDKQLNMALDYLKRATTQIGNRKAG